MNFPDRQHSPHGDARQAVLDCDDAAFIHDVPADPFLGLTGTNTLAFRVGRFAVRRATASDAILNRDGTRTDTTERQWFVLHVASNTCVGACEDAADAWWLADEVSIACVDAFEDDDPRDVQAFMQRVPGVIEWLRDRAAMVGRVRFRDWVAAGVASRAA